MFSTLGSNNISGIRLIIIVISAILAINLYADDNFNTSAQIDPQSGCFYADLNSHLSKDNERINVQFGWPRRMLGDASLTGRCLTVFDFDRNGDFELSIITTENRLYVYQHDGANYPSFPLQPHIGNRPRSWTNPSHPAVSAFGNIDGDDYPDLVYCTDIGYLHAVNVNGYEPRAYPVDLGLNIKTGVPALIDMSENDTLDIVINTISNHPDSLEADGIMHVFTSNGTELRGWPMRYPHGSVSSPVVGNIDDNPQNEIVVGNARYLDSPAQVWAWHNDGTVVDGFPVGRFETINGHPTLADITGDGMLDIVVWAAEYRGEAAGVWAWNGAGNALQGFPLETGSGHPIGGPVVVDLDDDGTPEIAFGTADPYNGAQVFVWTAGGDLWDNFPIQLASPSVVGEVLIADISGDRLPDIIAATAPEEGSGEIHAWHTNGEPVDNFPISLDDLNGGAFAGTPTIWDIDRDGDQDLIAVTTDRRIFVWDTRGKFLKDSWFTFKGGMTRTGIRPIDDPLDINNKRAEPVVASFGLLQAAPNPFNGQTRLKVDLAHEGYVSIDLIDLAGRVIGQVFAGDVKAGSLEISLNAEDYKLSAGLYLCRWKCGDMSGVSRIVYMP